MAGAVLTQNTAWVNVERALSALKERIPLTAEAILSLPPGDLAERLRPVGYFNVKTRRLCAFCEVFLAHGGTEGLSRLETGDLRRLLLEVHGIGPETADDMLLYAFERPVFVVDAYTRRLFSRLGLLKGAERYETIRLGFESALGLDVGLFNEYHALVVRHGKEICRPRPNCLQCCLTDMCPYPAGTAAAVRNHARKA